MTYIKSLNMRKTYQYEGSCDYALCDCNLQIKEGEFVVISGGKASGKTTLLHLLGGYERPSGGDLYYNNNNLSVYNDEELNLVRRQEVGYILQNNSLISDLNVHDNIIMPMVLSGRKVDEEYYEEITKRLHLTELLNRHPKYLTNSQLRYVIYARALIHKPSIILMDEYLDPFYPQVEKDVLNFLLNDVYHNNRILIMVTNNQEIKACANHIIRLRNGVVVEDSII